MQDLSPYLPSVIPGLKESLLDPVPEVRGVSAHALGAMVKGMGEAGFEELGPWLMEKLRSESSTVDRSGAALGQGHSMSHGLIGKYAYNKIVVYSIHVKFIYNDFYTTHKNCFISG